MRQNDDSSSTGGPPRTLTLKRDTPLPMRPAIPRGLLQFPPGTEISYQTLVSMMEAENRRSGRYDAKAFQMVRSAYRFADDKYKDEQRMSPGKGILGTRLWGKRIPAITHQLTIAMRSARFGQSKEAACAALLHDLVEEGKATPAEILAIFNPDSHTSFTDSAELEQSAQRVLDIVLLLTKPRFSAEGMWVFPDNPEFLEIEDRYEVGQYDARSNAYYTRLLKSMDMAAIFLKILDNIHNAETMQGIPEDQRQRNLRTMITHTLDCAVTIFDKEDVDYVLSLFTAWGFDIPVSALNRPVPKDGVAILPSRGGFGHDVWTHHPLPSSGPYISLYWDLPAAIMGHCEIGLPPALQIDHESVLREYVSNAGHPFQLTRGKSLVSEHLPIHEEIFIASGFSSLSRFLVPSTRQGWIAFVNERGKPVFELLGSALNEETLVAKSEHLKRAMEKVKTEISLLQDALKKMYTEQIATCISYAPPKQ